MSGTSKDSIEYMSKTIDCAKARDWLMSHYREYFALRKPISEFENDFTTAMTTEK